MAEPLDISRREFLAGSGAFALSGASAVPEPWFGKPMRWAQLTLVENDPGKYDPKFWLDFFARTHSDAATLSAGGCIAYYPTKIPLHYRSKWMKSSDPFGELYEGCRKLGMVVVARTDPHAVHQDVADAHPDWIAVDAGGNERRHWAQPELWVTCALGPYNFDFMTEVHREILGMYKVDGIFTNRWSGSGMCYCDHCQTNFRKASGLDLPRTLDPQDPSRRAYILWRQQRLFELWRVWDDAIRKLNPGARYIANAGGGAMSDLDMKTIAELSETLFADRQARRGLTAPWANGKNGKEYRAALGSKAIVGIFSVGVEEPYRWKDSVQTDAEIKIWAHDGIANGLRPWFTKFSGVIRDPRWLKTVEDIYRWDHKNERYLRNQASLARVAMVYSQQSATFYGGPQAHTKVEDHTLGYYHALIEARIPFEMVHDRMLDAANVDRFRVLVLPNVAALSGEQCRQLSAYVQRGGSIVATHETSRYDEWGVKRSDLGLASLFGVRDTGRTEGPMQNSYLRLEGQHPMLKGLEGVPRIINGVNRVLVEAAGSQGPPPITLIPSYPDLPMEEVYPREEETNIAEVFLREYGRGRVVYFPWDIDRTYWDVMCPDHGKLLVNAVEWAANEPTPVEVSGRGVLDVTLWRQEGSMTVHLVNLTNPMMMKGPFREFFPVGPFSVRVKLPPGATPRGVQLLTAGTSHPISESAGWLTVSVPQVELHEVIAIDL